MKTLLTFGILFLLLVLVFYLLFPAMRSIFPTPARSRRKDSTEFAEEVSPPEVQYLWKGPLAEKSGAPELPPLDSAGRLMLMVQNPNCLYAYWTLPGVSPENSESSQQLLVFEHWGEKCRQILEFSLPVSHRESYINVPDADSMYHVEIIWYQPDGTQHKLISHFVSTPAAAISSVLDENWLPCGVYSRLGQISYGLSSTEFQQNRGDNH